jgi:hypothetical protein
LSAAAVPQLPTEELFVYVYVLIHDLVLARDDQTAARDDARRAGETARRLAAMP